MTKSTMHLALSSLTLSAVLFAGCVVDETADPTLVEAGGDVDGSDVDPDAPAELTPSDDSHDDSDDFDDDNDEASSDDPRAVVLDIAAPDDVLADEAGASDGTGEARRARGCTVRVMFPRIGTAGVSAASNATGSCYRGPAPRSTS
ncbi:MAG: hypothetical protein M3680_10020 [Myxococcota bacterium]|nr:hypothetical protein [Myxococcota bacterium]